MSAPPVLIAAPVTLRHVKRAAAGTAVVGATYAAQGPVGVNGDRGYQSGTYEPSLNDEGTATVRLPNAVGEDGVLHRRRFACLIDSSYEIGDEWIEVWEGVPGRGRALFVGTPVDWRKTRAEVTLTLADGSALLAAQRTFAAGFWYHAPRDAFEHHTKTWRTLLADDFIGGYDAARWVAGGLTPGTVTAQPSAARLTPSTTDGGTTTLSTFGSYWPSVSLRDSLAWRMECRYSQALVGSVGVALLLAGGGGESATLQTDAAGSVLGNVAFNGGVSAAQRVERAIAKTATDVTLAIERHDRWALFYVQGALVWAVEVNWTLATTSSPQFATVSSIGAGAGGYVDLDYMIVRDLQPYLMRGTDKGDYRLPGSPTPGGLKGAYFDDAALRPVGYLNADYYLRLLAPTRRPYARRQDATINFPTATPPTWQPTGPPSGEYFSVRWTGAIYLDLATADVTLRLDQLDDAARLWVGKTMAGQHLLTHWQSPAGLAPFTVTSGSLRTHLGASLTGWYPIRLEYSSGAGTVGLVFQQSIGGGAYAVVPATSLSPFGIYEAEVRYDSHAEQIRGLVESFGYQYRVEPRSLETGLFPGEMVPRIRVGRDTDKVLEPPESTDVTVSGSARETVAALLADAAGLADQANAAQLTAEAVNFSALWATPVASRHLAVTSGYESLSDITDPALLRTRLASMLTLRSAPWEEIGARPRGAREIRDTFPPSFPVAGALAAFDWEPGDGVRLRDDTLDLDDDAPRQIIAPSWPFGPDGRGAPTVRFRQRPRSQQDALRELIRTVLLPQRNYQGQVVAIDGTWSHLDGAGAYSRIALPADAATSVIDAELVVTYKSDTSSWTIRDGVTLSTILTFNSPGHFPILPWVQRRTDAVGGSGQEFIVERVAGTGSAIFTLRLYVRT
jgi:hypothetical protein